MTLEQQLAAHERTIRQLIAERDELAELVRQYREQNQNEYLTPLAFGLTSFETRIFTALMKQPMATKNSLMMELYRHGADEPSDNIINVFVCKIRNKTKPFGVAIKTVWGQGFALPKESKSLVHELLEREKANG